MHPLPPSPGFRPPRLHACAERRAEPARTRATPPRSTRPALPRRPTSPRIVGGLVLVASQRREAADVAVRATRRETRTEDPLVEEPRWLVRPSRASADSAQEARQLALGLAVRLRPPRRHGHGSRGRRERCAPWRAETRRDDRDPD